MATYKQMTRVHEQMTKCTKAEDKSTYTDNKVYKSIRQEDITDDKVPQQISMVHMIKACKPRTAYGQMNAGRGQFHRWEWTKS